MAIYVVVMEAGPSKNSANDGIPLGVIERGAPAAEGCVAGAVPVGRDVQGDLCNFGVWDAAVASDTDCAPHRCWWTTTSSSMPEAVSAICHWSKWRRSAKCSSLNPISITTTTSH